MNELTTYQPGIFIRLWCWLFGGNPYVSVVILGDCAVDYCNSTRDQRCRGSNCTKHCHEHCGYYGSRTCCIELDDTDGKAAKLGSKLLNDYDKEPIE